MVAGTLRVPSAVSRMTFVRRHTECACYYSQSVEILRKVLAGRNLLTILSRFSELWRERMSHGSCSLNDVS